jgi:hypothetical protein
VGGDAELEESLITMVIMKNARSTGLRAVLD